MRQNRASWSVFSWGSDPTSSPLHFDSKCLRQPGGGGQGTPHSASCFRVQPPSGVCAAATSSGEGTKSTMRRCCPTRPTDRISQRPRVRQAGELCRTLTLSASQNDGALRAPAIRHCGNQVGKPRGVDGFARTAEFAQRPPAVSLDVDALGGLVHVDVSRGGVDEEVSLDLSDLALSDQVFRAALSELHAQLDEVGLMPSSSFSSRSVAAAWVSLSSREPPGVAQ